MKNWLWQKWSAFARSPFYIIYAVGLPFLGVIIGTWLGGGL